MSADSRGCPVLFDKPLCRRTRRIAAKTIVAIGRGRSNDRRSVFSEFGTKFTECFLESRHIVRLQLENRLNANLCKRFRNL